MSALSRDRSTLSQETMLELMRYADGELDRDEVARARVEDLLRSSDEARRVVAAIGTLGEIVREGAAERADVADRIADRVMAGIAATPAVDAGGTDAGAKVVPLARPTPRARIAAAPAIVAGLALAAGVVLFIRSERTPSSHEGRFAAAAPRTVEAQDDDDTSDGALAQTEALGVDLEEVRSVRNKVDVFFVPSEKSSGASVVVWIDDRGDRHGEH